MGADWSLGNNAVTLLSNEERVQWIPYGTDARYAEAAMSHNVTYVQTYSGAI